MYTLHGGVHSPPCLQGSDNCVITSTEVLITKADDVDKIAPPSKKGVHVLNLGVDPAAVRYPAMLALINLLQDGNPATVLPVPDVDASKL